MSEKQAKTELFENMPVPRAVYTMAVPTVISSLIMVLYNLADTYFVGMLANPIQNAAVTLAAPALMAFNAVNNLFGVGSSSLMSRALGARDYDTYKKCSSFGFWCTIFSGVLFSVGCTVFLTPLLRLLGATAETMEATAAYMKWTVCIGAVPSILNVVMAYLVRSEGNSLHASIGTLSGCLLNIVLDPIFILPWGFNLGAAGAGIATFISNCVACCYFFVLLFVRRNKTYISISPKDFTLNKEIAGGVFSVGVPAAIQNLLNVTSMTVLNNFTAVYGSTAVAAMGVAQKIAQVPIQISMGLSQGVMPLISYNYTSQNYNRMKKVFTFSARISLIAMGVIVAGCMVFSPQLIKLFMNNSDIIAMGQHFLRAQAPQLLFLAMDFLAVGVFQACGMGRLSLVFAVLRKIILEIPFIYLCDWIYPMYGLAFSRTLAEIVMAVVALLVLKKLFGQLDSQGHLQ